MITQGTAPCFEYGVQCARMNHTTSIRPSQSLCVEARQSRRRTSPCQKNNCRDVRRPAATDCYGRPSVCCDELPSAVFFIAHFADKSAFSPCTVQTPVWFGESIPTLFAIEQVLSTCDLLLVLGTSSTVYPAAGFASVVRSRGGRAAVFNVEKSGGEEGEADWFFEGGVEDTLPWALGLSQKAGTASG